MTTALHATEITSIELKQRLDRGDKLKIVDVREPNEYQINRIPGSELIPLGDVPKRYEELNKNDEAITQAIIALSHSLGLRCTAEGVETNAQYNFLRVHGCEEAQGYLITEPLAESEFRSWWDAHATEFASAQRQRDLWQSRVG